MSHERTSTIHEWPAEHTDMHVCPDPNCHAPMMYPFADTWEQAEQKDSWRLTSRCGECGSLFCGTFSEQQIDDFDLALDDDSYAIAQEIRKIDTQHMTEYLEMFTAALRADQVFPEDF